MARLNFRQGIVRHQTDSNNNPTFLQKSGLYVNLLISPDPTILTFVHGDKNYLFTDIVTTISAWGPLAPGPDVWLYWDLDLISGIRTFGHTTVEPTEAGIAPVAPIVNQMWFNTSANIWFAWSGASWVEVIRVFAAKYASSTQFVSMSASTPAFTGTQVGLNVSNHVGSLAFDATGVPIRDGTNRFFTTEDQFVTGVPTGASLKVNNIIIRGQAQQPIGAYNVVAYSDYNKIVPAIPYTVLNRVYGITEEGANVGDVVNVITEGIIFNQNWDWEADGATINDAVYIDNTGQVVLQPVSVDTIPVGAVIGPQTILFDPTLYGLSFGLPPSYLALTCIKDSDADAFVSIGGTLNVPCDDIGSHDVWIKSGAPTTGTAGSLNLVSGTSDSDGGVINIMSTSPDLSASPRIGGGINLLTDDGTSNITMVLGVSEIPENGPAVETSYFALKAIDNSGNANPNADSPPELRMIDVTAGNHTGFKAPAEVIGSHVISLPSESPSSTIAFLTAVEPNGANPTTVLSRWGAPAYDITITKGGVIADGDLIGRSGIPRDITLFQNIGYSDAVTVIHAATPPTGSSAIFEVFSMSINPPAAPTKLATLTINPGDSFGNRTLDVVTAEVSKGYVVYINCVSANGVEDVTFTLDGYQGHNVTPLA